jgi:hypothetical protein
LRRHCVVVLGLITVLILPGRMEGKLEVKLALDEEEIKPAGEAIFTIGYDNNEYDSRLTHTSLYGTIFPQRVKENVK